MTAHQGGSGGYLCLSGLFNGPFGVIDDLFLGHLESPTTFF